VLGHVHDVYRGGQQVAPRRFAPAKERSGELDASRNECIVNRAEMIGVAGEIKEIQCGENFPPPPPPCASSGAVVGRIAPGVAGYPAGEHPWRPSRSSGELLPTSRMASRTAALGGM